MVVIISIHLATQKAVKKCDSKIKEVNHLGPHEVENQQDETILPEVESQKDNQHEDESKEDVPAAGIETTKRVVDI